MCLSHQQLWAAPTKKTKHPTGFTILWSRYKSHLTHCEDFCISLLCTIFSIYIIIGTCGTPYPLIERSEGICISLLYDVLLRGTHASPSPSITATDHLPNLRLHGTAWPYPPTLAPYEALGHNHYLSHVSRTLRRAEGCPHRLAKWHLHGLLQESTGAQSQQEIQPWC